MKLDSAGLPVPDRDDMLNIQLSGAWFCPTCKAPTWPDVHDGQLRARHCIACQVSIDREEGHGL